MKYILFVCLSITFCLFGFWNAQAQILNDSTVNLYSPKTTRVLQENDIFRGQYELRQVDTTLNNLQQIRNWYHDTTFYQDLGNLATPAKRLYYTLPDQIGARYGRYVFDRYNYIPANQTYYDTKSPFSRLSYVQGGNGQQIFDGTFSRNINENSNVGFTYERLSSEKFYGTSNTRGTRQVERTGITLFTHFQTKENRYHLFANINYAEHAMLESGGINNSDDSVVDSLYQTDNVQVFLNSATNREYRKNAHLSQVFQIAKDYLKVYHTLDYRSQFNRFKDTDLAYNTTNGKIDSSYFYPNVIYDSASTSDASEFRMFENSIGVMSDSKLHFFRGYFKQRNVNYSNSLLNVERNLLPGTLNDSVNVGFNDKIRQYFLGGHGEFIFRDVFNVTVNGEYQLFDDYRLDAALRLKFLTVSQSRTSYSPTLTQQRLISNHFEWNTDFQNTVADRSAVRVNGTLFHNSLDAELARTNIQSYIYFNEKAVPVQTSNQLQLYTLSVKHHLALKNFHWENNFVYTDNNKAEEIRVPKWMVNTKVYFQGHLFKKALYGQVGAEMYVQDEFLADTYMPATQQFYLQNRTNGFIIPTYPLIDAFITADIKSFNIFVKMAHVNQGFPADGYFTTPIYLGQPRNLTFGLRWMFFD